MNDNCCPNSDSKYLDQLRRHYAPLVIEHGGSFRAVDWGSDLSQNKRFEVLLGCTDFRQAKILDVGCGVGHLVTFLKKNGFKGSYLGIDLVPEMIDKAKLLNSDFNFQVVKSLNDLDGFETDLVVASGLFTFADEFRLKDTIAKLFFLTRHALVFNSLSNWKESQHQNEFHADPISTLQFCASLTKKLIFRHDYMPHDFSVYLYK
jgi:SAM-dependent methyltransferase